MTTKKTLLSILIAFILSNVLTTIWYMLTDEANMIPYRRSEMNYGALVLNHLIYAALFVYLFPSFFEKKPQSARGILYGAVVSLIMFLPQAMVVRAIWEVDFNGIFVLNTLTHTAIGGIMGLSISIIYNYKNSTK